MALKRIEKLENEPHNIGMVYSLVIGIIGTIFMALSVFAITTNNPRYVSCILFGTVDIMLWILPYFVYRKVKNDKENSNVSLIEEEYNTIYDSCEQAKKILR